MSTVKPIEVAATDFFKHFRDFTNLQTLSTENLEAATEALYASSEAFRNELYQTPTTNPAYQLNPKGHLKEILQETKAPFALALRLIEALSSEEMQSNDHFKYLVSKTAFIFWELIAFKFALEGRNIYLETRNAIAANLKRVLTTLPKKEIETRFYIQCLQALAKKFQPGEGKSKEIIKENGPALIKGALEVVCSASPQGANPAALVSPLVDLCVSIYREIEERWYREVWAMSWIFSGGRITRPKQVEQLKPFMQGYDKESKQAFYISQLYFEIIRNVQVSDEVKRDLFEKEHPNLLELASISNAIKIERAGLTLRKDRFWKVRYITVKHLTELASDQNFRIKSMKKLVERYTEEKDPYVGETLFKAFTSFAEDKAKKKDIHEALQDIDLNKKIAEVKNQVASLRDKITVTSYGVKKEHLKAELDKKIANLEQLEKLKAIKTSMEYQKKTMRNQNALEQVTSTEEQQLIEQISLVKFDELIVGKRKECNDLEEKKKAIERVERQEVKEVEGVSNQLDRLQFLASLFTD